MKSVTVTVNLNEKTHISKFDIESSTPEYIIADQAFRIGLLFAETQILATYGHPLNGYEFAKFVEGLDYNYEIEDSSLRLSPCEGE